MVLEENLKKFNLGSTKLFTMVGACKKYLHTRGLGYKRINTLSDRKIDFVYAKDNFHGEHPIDTKKKPTLRQKSPKINDVNHQRHLHENSQ